MLKTFKSHEKKCGCHFSLVVKNGKNAFYYENAGDSWYDKHDRFERDQSCRANEK